MFPDLLRISGNAKPHSGHLQLQLPHRSGPWETDVYTPPELGGAASFDISVPALHKNPAP